MPVTPEQLSLAQTQQHSAARDTQPQVRLIAGPGSGKSFAIEERVNWLLDVGVEPTRIFVVSFTNVAADDLGERIRERCKRSGQDATRVSVTTLHSMALRVLRVSQLLARFPASPLVLDRWETQNIFTEEFMHHVNIGKKRADYIRQHREAFWSTGGYDPPNYAPPNPPVSEAEQNTLVGFLSRFEQVYSCILPGAIVRECVDQIDAGLADPAPAVGIEQLVVDEYQDLNPVDQRFVEAVIGGGAVTMIAGDDDQSVYSFRFAMPRGIQDFVTLFPDAGDHALTQCFRCASRILEAAQALIAANPPQNRIPKTCGSVYLNSAPPVPGIVERWIFESGTLEARAIAESCVKLIAAGHDANSIFILLSDRRVLLGTITEALSRANVRFDSRAEPAQLAEPWGRLILGVLRLVGSTDDYVAYRTLIGLLPGFGQASCALVRDTVVNHGLNYRALFHDVDAANHFDGRVLAAIGTIRAMVDELSSWTDEDQLDDRRDGLVDLCDAYGDDVTDSIRTYLDSMPGFMSLREFRQITSTGSTQARTNLLRSAYENADKEIPDDLEGEPAVKIMTMHGAKGLSAHTVFIPGLEEELVPGGKRAPYPGLVEEAARLLYVSIIRARALCVMSFAQRRAVYGRPRRRAPSRFNRATAGKFVARRAGLDDAQVQAIVEDSVRL